MRYTVIFEVYASTSVSVEASSREEAIDRAAPQAYAGVCCHCSKDIEVGDIGDVLEVLNEDGDEVPADPGEGEGE